ncbi:MAG TPA: hypothetical protein VKD90_13305 [Gemmataceae bacterium]|nr:hypothetical protein [Gemmataceae bacterium]
MEPHRLSSVAVVFAAALLTGCVAIEKPRPKDADRAAAPAGEVKPAAAAQAAPQPTDPLPPGQSPKFIAFLTNQGLATPTAKIGEANRLTAAWNNKIIYAPDPTRGGEPVPGLMGRLYLFGPDEKHPLPTEGELIVGVWDNTPKVNGGEPALLELWHIDAQTAKKFQRHDLIGDGYTIFLPWSKYHVDLKQVSVRARFNGADGRCLVASPETLTIDHSATLQRAAEKLGLESTIPGKPSTTPAPQSLPPSLTIPLAPALPSAPTSR